MRRIPQGRIVEHTPTGKKGVTVDDFMSCCTPDETPVVYDGYDSFSGTNTEDLRDLGPYKAPNVGEKCGLGHGEHTCQYLTVGPDGLECARFSSLRMTIIMKGDMKAKGSPVHLYPGCQNDILKTITDKEASAA